MPRPRRPASRRPALRARRPAPSTVGRAKPVVLRGRPRARRWEDDLVSLHHGDALDLYASWPAPAAIVSDGAYGVLGFDGDTSDHLDVPAWYEPHAAAWARAATPATTLWFWNSEIGWAAAHPVLERHGWRYVACNVWNKGRGHVAGNVNTGSIRRFPVVTEVCVQYVRAPVAPDGAPLKAWLLSEWRRTGLPLREANAACGVKDAAVRKYLDQSHLWYFPPPEAMARLAAHANAHGRPEGRPYFALDGAPATAEAWAAMRARFRCPFGVTNVWDRAPVAGPERVRAPGGRAVHLNQKPLDLLERIIQASTDPGEVVWEPFGGLFTAALAARRLGRRAFAAELDPTYFRFGVARAAGTPLRSRGG
ncbi:DNA methyltransferase [Anaeromyxobacter oryzisoli]|uniref:DNA methyltransferase n=1 Tax=Anaeromyxobacter oryzisoli TaxID=2925408 RepID=UPI001F55F09F|nr:DNA methyltransferase [Anaeromyxobacter sp. SG63]